MAIFVLCGISRRRRKTMMASFGQDGSSAVVDCQDGPPTAVGVIHVVVDVDPKYEKKRKR